MNAQGTYMPTLTKEQRMADLSLRGWILAGDYMFKRRSPTQIAVCMRSSLLQRFDTTTIPFTAEEERNNGHVEGWTLSDAELEDAHGAAARCDARYAE